MRSQVTGQRSEVLVFSMIAICLGILSACAQTTSDSKTDANQVSPLQQCCFGVGDEHIVYSVPCLWYWNLNLDIPVYPGEPYYVCYISNSSSTPLEEIAVFSDKASCQKRKSDDDSYDGYGCISDCLPFTYTGGDTYTLPSEKHFSGSGSVTRKGGC